MKKGNLNYQKLTALAAVLTITTFFGVSAFRTANSALRANTRANLTDTFSMKDATTSEDNGKRLRAKPGFELVKEGKETETSFPHGDTGLLRNQ
jgi:hypothetical protein